MFPSLCVSALLVAAATAKLQPNPPLNPNPTDTTNPRLIGKAFPFNNLPEQADTSGPQTGVVFRGTQSGYNRCNSTTEGPKSLCQTLIVNSIDDFCVWGPPGQIDAIGNQEADVVAYCNKPGHGARLIPEGTFQSLQFITTPSYVAFVGVLDVTKVNIIAGDNGGGELDSSGQDDRANPIGGLVYSTALPSAPGVITQSRTWSMFIGNGQVCFKACDPTAPNAAGLCQHLDDSIGCEWNVPTNAPANTFLSCEGEDQDPVGENTVNGVVTTYHQAEPPAPLVFPDFTPRIPSTSNCVTTQETALFQSVAPTTTGSGTSTTPTGSSGTASGSKSSSGSGTGSGSGSGSGAAAPTTTPASGTGKSGAAPSAAGAGAFVLAAALLLGAALVA